MRSQLAARVGAQRPNLWAVPEAVDSLGESVVELAAACGLQLDDWQAWVLDQALRIDRRGKWSAFEVGLILPRQNGKNAILEAVELAGLVLWPKLFGRPWVTSHSAHKFSTASEHFLRMRALINGCDDVRRLVKTVHVANGKESITMLDGSRLKFVARTRGASRGATDDLIVFDEAFDLPASSLGAMLPSLSARPNPQVWFASSAPHHDSTVLHRLRDRAQKSDSGRLAHFEWGNPPDVDPLDRDAWYVANPALGIRISEEFVESEQRALPADEFARERLGVAQTPDMFAGVLNFGAWETCEDKRSQVDQPAAIGFDVSPERTWASFAIAARREDDLTHVEVVDRREGTGWVVERAVELTTRYGRPLVVDPRSPAGGTIGLLVDAGVTVVELSGQELTQACAGFQDAVLNARLAHIGQGPLDAAVAGASTRHVGEAWSWSRISSQVDISPLVACTLAFARVGAGAPECVFAY
jgi:phage terminase large subunit-like protein